LPQVLTEHFLHGVGRQQPGLGIDASSIAVVSGHGSPAKIVAVDGMDDEAIRAASPGEKPGQSGG
jgi:hypothetical protein